MGDIESPPAGAKGSPAAFEISAEVVEWLLAGDPAIRWQVFRDLLDRPADQVAAERARVAGTGWGKRLLDHQDPEGTWAHGLYGPKWTSTTYTLLLLRHCGLPPDIAAAQRGVALLWEGARYFDDGLTAAVTIDLPEACITSMYVALACYFGHSEPRVDGALEWLLRNQLPDGGWNCLTVRFGDRHGSFHTTISALEAIWEASRRDPERGDLGEAMARGQEFLLHHRLYKSHRHGTVAHPAFTKFSFPPRWHYDVLRGLEYFAVAGAPVDDRHADAIELLHERRRADGRWPVQNRHSGKVWFEMERTGHASRWNTLRALRVLRWYVAHNGR